MRRFWTDAELAFLREHYGALSTGQLARCLERTVRSVYHAVGVHGLKRRGRLAVTRAVIAEVRRRHRAGQNDSEIAQALGCWRQTVGRVRRRLGLSERSHSGATARRKVESQRRTLGIATAGELRRLSYRRYAARNGWPEDLRPRAVQILNLLAGSGLPLTRRMIARGIGLPWIDSRRSLKSNDPEGSYLAHLVKRGLVLRLPRARPVHGEGRGRTCDLYALGPVALGILEERARCERNESTRTR
jgi:hypothetical protein